MQRELFFSLRWTIPSIIAFLDRNGPFSNASHFERANVATSILCANPDATLTSNLSSLQFENALSKGFPLLPNIRDDPLLVRDEMQGQLGLGNAP